MTKLKTIKYRITTINNILKVSIGVIVSEGEVSTFKGKIYNNQNIVKSKIQNGTTTYNISYNPFVTLDFTSYNDMKEAKDVGVIPNGCRIVLNRYNLFLFINILKNMVHSFVTNKELYYYSNGKLILNTDVGDKLEVSSMIADKMVILKPVVVEVSSSGKEHEGIIFALNDLSYSTLLTYTEMSYLLFILSHLDLDLITMQMIELVGEGKIYNSVYNTIIDVSNPTKHELIAAKEEDDGVPEHIVVLKNENVIPKL